MLVVLAWLAVTAPPAAHAAPSCTLAPRPEPCDDVAARAPSLDLAPRSPWLDDGSPVRTAPEVTPEDGDHRVRSLVVLGGIYAAVGSWMYLAWYHDQPRLDGFTVGGDGYFGEDTYAGGADKLGHAWANTALTRGGAEMLRWGGWRRRPAAIISASLSWSLFLVVEIKDGYYYQLSPGDMIGNTAGALLGVALTEWPALDRLLDFRVDYVPSAEYRSIIAGTYTGDQRLNSANFADDYSGQNYFLAAHLAALPRPASLPRWLDAALDYVDVGVGFRTRSYKPDPPDDQPSTRQQSLYVTMTLNLQHLVDRALHGRRGAGGGVRSVLHGLSEMCSLPYSVQPLLGVSRSPDE